MRSGTLFYSTPNPIIVPGMNAKLHHTFACAGVFLDRHARIAAAILLALLFLCSLVQAADKPFWYDEIFTYLSAALPGWTGVWGFYAQGADTPSPLPALIVHATLRFTSNPEITARIPFMLAFVFMSLCIYIFMRRRYSTGYALAALFAPVAFPFFFYFSSEIRAYALVLAGAGLSMVCWQFLASNPTRRAAANWNALGLWFGLAFAICAHTFAIFLFVPFALAQLVADLQNKKPDLRVWLALLLFPLGLVPVLHGELVASHAYRGSFFSKPDVQVLQLTYQDMFGPVSICATILLFAILVLVLRRSRAVNSSPESPPGFTRPEVVFAVVLAILPLYAWPVSMLIGVFREAYMVPACIGIVLCIFAAVAELAQQEVALGAALLAALLLLGCARNAPWFHWRSLARLDRVHMRFVQGYNRQNWVRLVAASSLPVAVSDDQLYLKSRFYWPPQMQQRLWFPTSLSLASNYPDSATIQLNIVRTGKLLSLPAMDWKDFSAAYPHFLLVVGNARSAWLASYLAHQPRSRVKIELLGPGFKAPAVYDVQLTNP
jgi:Dolichyl-phosphate-mannose-protein mannosyltransferase